MIRRYAQLFFVCGIMTIIGLGYYSTSYALAPQHSGVADPASALSMAMSAHLHDQNKAKKSLQLPRN